MPGSFPTLIAVADGARARFFTHQDDHTPQGNRLTETQSMICPSRRERVGDLSTETRPGLHSGGPSGPAHAVDDHRIAHREELERRFAKQVVQSLVDSTPEHTHRILLFAAPTMLAKLRDALDLHTAFCAKKDVITQSLNLVKLTPTELHDRLAKGELLPPRTRLPRAH